jgi:glutathione S-transferase
MTLKLHVFPLSPRAFKVTWAATHLGVEFEPVLVDFSKGTHRTPEFAGLNPNMRMPVLEEDGFVLWESNAIVQYLASKQTGAGLLPDEPKARASIAKWQFWDSSHWDPACAIFAFENYVKKLFGRGQLQKHRYVAGEALTAADISLGAMFWIAEHAQFPLEEYRGIQRWAADLKSLPSWQKAAADAMAMMPAR